MSLKAYVCTLHGYRVVPTGHPPNQTDLVLVNYIIYMILLNKTPQLFEFIYFIVKHLKDQGCPKTLARARY
jgi:hypothetical protein